MPWQREIMDAITDPAVEEIYCMKSAQVGWTEILLNTFGYFCAADPSPIMLVQPTLLMGETFSKERLAPMIRDTPTLTSKIDAKSRDSGNTLLNKQYHGGHLAITGANSPAGLRARPIRILLLDEIDAYPASAGAEGDPMSLAKNRQKTFWNRKTLGGSTPTVKGASRIEAAMMTSDQCHFEFPCIHCGTYQRLVWAQVKWTEFDLTPAEAVYQCVSCGERISDPERIEMLEAGYRVVPEGEFAGIRGYYVNELMSPFSTMGQMAVSFVDARKAPETLQAWINSALGETWVDASADVKADKLTERREPYGPELIPAGVLIMTIGVDTQDDRLEAQLLGWGVDEECWVIEQKVLPGDPGGKTVWRALTAYRYQTYMAEDGRVMRPIAACVDAGGHYAQQVYDYCYAFRTENVYAIRGIGGVGRLVWPTKPGRTKLHPKAKVWSIGVDTIKDSLYPRLGKVLQPGPSYIHLPFAWTDDLSEQLTSEQKIFRNVHGRRVGVWRPKRLGVRQEAQDCWNYGFAALKSAEARGISLAKLSAAVATRAKDELSQPRERGDKIDATQEPRSAPPTDKRPASKRKRLRSRSSDYLNRR